jgi:hypothetical protein
MMVRSDNQTHAMQQRLYRVNTLVPMASKLRRSAVIPSTRRPAKVWHVDPCCCLQGPARHHPHQSMDGRGRCQRARVDPFMMQRFDAVIAFRLAKRLSRWGGLRSGRNADVTRCWTNFILRVSGQMRRRDRRTMRTICWRPIHHPGATRASLDLQGDPAEA